MTVKRRILSIIFCLALLLQSGALLAQAAPAHAQPAPQATAAATERSTAALGNDVHVSGDWMYYADRESGRFPDRILIVKYTGSATDVTVPNGVSSGLSGYTVSSPYTASARDHIFGNEFPVVSGGMYRVFVTAKRTAGSLPLHGGKIQHVH